MDADKRMGKINTLKLETAFEFTEGTTQASPEVWRRGAPDSRSGPALDEGEQEGFVLL